MKLQRRVRLTMLVVAPRNEQRCNFRKLSPSLVNLLPLCLRLSLLSRFRLIRKCVGEVIKEVLVHQHVPGITVTVLHALRYEIKIFVREWFHGGHVSAP